MGLQETITKKQKEVLDFIQSFSEEHGYAPSLKEIKEQFNFSSHSTAQFHVNKLTEKGFLKKRSGSARGVEVLENDSSLELPVLGEVAAGNAIEAIEDSNPEIVRVPKSMLKDQTNRHYLLRVNGDSMEGKHILSGDLVIIREQSHFNNGDVAVIADENWQVTLKEIIKESQKLTLKPANPKYQIYSIALGKCQVIGKMVGLLRQ